MGFTRNYVTIAPRGLLHHGSTLTCAGGDQRSYARPSAVRFCGTSLQLALTGRYPASCPMEPGLSSRGERHQRLSVKLSFAIDASASIQGIGAKLNCRIPANYTNRNGSVSICEAMTAVSHFRSSSLRRKWSATPRFMIFSTLCPGSISAIPAAKASCAV